MDAYKNRHSLIIDYKSDGCDFVTETDKLVEKNLIEGILTLFPDAIIHGEEYGLTEDMTEDRPIFVIDPIDGTKGFIRNDQYALALALIEDGEVVLGPAVIVTPQNVDTFKF